MAPFDSPSCISVKSLRPEAPRASLLAQDEDNGSSWQQQTSYRDPGPSGPLAGQNVMNVILVGAECAPWSKTGKPPWLTSYPLRYCQPESGCHGWLCPAFACFAAWSSSQCLDPSAGRSRCTGAPQERAAGAV